MYVDEDLLFFVQKVFRLPSMMQISRNDAPEDILYRATVDHCLLVYWRLSFFFNVVNIE